MNSEHASLNAAPRPPLLQLNRVETAYGDSKVLFGVDLEIEAGQCVALLGRNGMGKSTTVKTIMGLQPCLQGQVKLRGASLNRLKPHQIAHAGIGLVPEGRRVFPNLSVRENLVATAKQSGRSGPGWSLDDIYSLFPRLRERERHLGCNLSGGEQQMLAIGRALMTRPRLLLLDEPTLGLAPLVIAQIFDIIREIREQGVTVFLVEQNANKALGVADRGYVLENGRVVLQDTGANLLVNDQVRKAYLGG